MNFNNGYGTLKRGRTDGQVRKEDYYQSEESSAPSNPGAFLRATPGTLASRRKVVSNISVKKREFLDHIFSLNSKFYEWFQSECQADDNNDMTDGIHDYISFVKELEDRYLRTYGEVLTFGSGDCGQLAHGVDSDEDLMVRFPRVVYSLRDKKVSSISCGGLHNAVCTEDGLVYTWGCSDEGSLGRIGDENQAMLVQSLSDAGETVISVACGDGQTFAVGASGNVWGWGCYKDKEGKMWFDPAAGQDIKRRQPEPMKLTCFGKEAEYSAVEVSCGGVYNIVRCEDGRVLSWGLGECGELSRKVPPLKNANTGEYNKSDMIKFHLTPGPMMIQQAGGGLVEAFNPKAIGCGAYHAMAVIGSSVYACGLNNYGQLGTGNTDSSDYLMMIPALEGREVVSVKGGMHHSLVLTRGGKVLAFGRADSGQLGIARLSGKAAGEFLAIPEEVVIEDSSKGEAIEVSAICCGSNHNMVLRKNSTDVYSWGYGDMLALGHGKEQDEFRPKKINFAKSSSLERGSSVGEIVQISGGGQHSAIIAQIKGSLK